MMDRRIFLKSMGAATVLSQLPSRLDAFAKNTDTVSTVVNKLPRWRGFNLLDFFSPVYKEGSSNITTENDLKWMSDWGFDFIRIPMAYPSYLKFDASDRTKQIKPEEVVQFDEAGVERVERLVYLANKYGLHVSLNLHRAPGFCINAGFHEPYNLWRDAEAQEALYTHWGMWAKRFKNVSPKMLSFDLLNEACAPVDMNDQFSPKPPVEGNVYRKVAEGCIEVIKKENKKRLIVADGNGGGSLVVPELVDLPLAQSCRGYYPHYISHYRAPWVWKNPDDSPAVEWPGKIDGKQFNRETLEKFYEPWIQLLKSGVGVHCGECGCYRETPHQVFLNWFEDQLSIFTQYGIGYSLWNFRGDFGILDSKRKDINYKEWYGHQLDERMLSLLQKY